MAIVTKRTVMTLYSDDRSPHSQQVRMVLAEKGVNYEKIIVNEPNDVPQALLEINPYGTTPTLCDRDLVLYEPRIIMEYLEERFPYPPLFPVYPVMRAEQRKMMHRIETDWYSLYFQILFGGENAQQARHDLQDSFISLDPVFADKPYFLSDEFSLVDCTLAPLMWRLPLCGIHLPPTAKGLKAYLDRVFKRPCFQVSLSDFERELRAA